MNKAKAQRVKSQQPLQDQFIICYNRSGAADSNVSTWCAGAGRDCFGGGAWGACVRMPQVSSIYADVGQT